MGYLKDLYGFINKLNKRQAPYTIADEVLFLTDGKWEGFLSHDNVLGKTIEIYTQPSKQGNRILNYTIEPKDETWKTYIKVFSQGEKVYISYETFGDTVEAEDINNLQWAIDKLDVELEKTTTNLKNHVSNSEIHITQAERSAWNDKVERVELELTNEVLNDHKSNKLNPHGVTKEQLQLERVDNVQQASKVDFENHVSDTISHIINAERNSWNDKYTKSEVDNKLSALETKIDWKESVATFDDIVTTYPKPFDGWTVNVKDTDYTYRYSGSEWVVISANAIPKATVDVDGLLSKEDKIILDDVNNKKHSHSNKSVVDTITSVLISNWNSAFTHISDMVKHITSSERTLWNTVSNKVDKVEGQSLSSNDFTSIYKSKLDGITSNATKTEVSTTNGNIKINGTETTVYKHPTGTNPHGTTKADVGLSNVDNTSDLNKPISTATQIALNGKANTSHTHSEYITKDDLGSAGYGDMLKSVYDTNGDGVVDKAESVAWTGVTGKPTTFPPSTHNHTKSQITDFPTSLPANGGNADTLDGKHASDFLTTTGITWNDLKGV